MDANKSKQGMSVRELESFAKKHRFEVFFCLTFILSCFFSFVMFGPGWAIIVATIGALIGVLLADKIANTSKSLFRFVFKQEQTTQLILGIVGLIIAIFLPPVFFLILGLHGGKDLLNLAVEISAQQRKD